MDIQQTIIYATLKHLGQSRKCGNIPYIVHPMEVMYILTQFGGDENLIKAGILHDVVEDTHTSICEIENNFGSDVATLVSSHTENKVKSWKERKQFTIDNISHLTFREQQLLCADQISNTRNLTRDLSIKGNKMWESFNGKSEGIFWYYTNVCETLKKYMTPCPILNEYINVINQFICVYNQVTKQN